MIDMPLAEDQKQNIVKNLDNFDAALADKPVLASIYCPKWRKQFRQKALGVITLGDSSYPEAYGAPYFENLRQFPRCYQQRLEEGASVLLPKLMKSDRNNLIKRLRETNPASGAEEILLARGFALQFGVDSIEAPESDQSKPRPEFIVNISGKKIEIEAKGLLDSKKVQELNSSARELGQSFWITFDPTINDLHRVENAIKRKLRKPTCGDATLVVLTQYTAWPAFDDTISLVRKMALCPHDFEVYEAQYPLALALTSGCRQIHGVWFNSVVLERERIDDLKKERLRSSLMQSFYSCTDSVFFDESMSEDEHKKMLERVRARGHT